jgi:hypothetical protein
VETDSIQYRFNNLQWHDSKLLSFSNQQSDGIELFVMNIEMLGWSKAALSPVRVVLMDVAYLEVSVDLDAKRQLADTISAGYCVEESPLRSQLEATLSQAPGGGLEGYLQFHLTLLPPAGRIDIFAKDFNVEPDPAL